MNREADIFSYIKSQEALYRQPIRVNDYWDWSMRETIQTTDAYLNEQLTNGKTDYTPVKNIMRPILNLHHRTEDIELKDVVIYADDPSKEHLSFLVKKYHDDVYVQKYDLDTYFDELGVSRIDYGGGLSKNMNKPCPEVVPLQTIAFCDQTDMLSGAIGIKHHYSPDQLLEMKKYNWGNSEYGATNTIEELIALSEEYKSDNGDNVRNRTPSRYIEVYEVHGNLPKRFADLNDTSGEYETRIFIVAFYSTTDSIQKKGVVLFTAPEKEMPFKLIKRDPIFGRALGKGAGEEIFENQVWTNYNLIRMHNMLDAAATTILKTTDPTLVQKHPSGFRNMKPFEIIDIAQGTDVAQVDTYPRNIALFEKQLEMWERHAQMMGNANDAIMGESPASGTPFKLQELVTQEAHSMHEYRRQQFAKHIEEVYRDWIIPHIQKEICKGVTFLSELSLEELQYVEEKMANAAWNKYSTEKVLNGLDIEQGEQEAFITDFKSKLKKQGNKRFIEILKDEFRGIRLAVKVSVSGKSKNLAMMTDKIVNVFRFAFSNPQGFAQAMQIPGMSKSFNQILEFSGLSPVDFSNIKLMEMGNTQPTQTETQPLSDLATNQMQNA